MKAIIRRVGRDLVPESEEIDLKNIVNLSIISDAGEEFQIVGTYEGIRVYTTEGRLVIHPMAGNSILLLEDRPESYQGVRRTG